MTSTQWNRQCGSDELFCTDERKEKAQCLWKPSCSGQHALLKIAHLVPPVILQGGSNICSTNEGTEDVSTQLTGVAAGKRSQDFTLGLLGSKVLLFFHCRSGESSASSHGYWKTTQSSVELEFLQLPFFRLRCSLGSKSAVSVWLLTILPHVTMGGGHIINDLTRQIQLNFHVIQSRERIALGMRLLWNKGSWS